MATSTTDTAADDADWQYVLDAFALLEEVKVDWTKLAAQKGISHRNNAYRKFRTTLQKHGFEFKDNQITKAGQDGSGIEGSPKKAATKKTRAKATPATRKRKLMEDTEKDAGDQSNDTKEGSVGA